MPELPEVETIRRQLAPVMEGRTLERLEVTDPRWCEPAPPEEVEGAASGRRIERLSRRGKYLVVELEGYTDNVGAMPYNVQLSQRRSEAVRRFLVEKGIEMHRIHSIGMGDIKPTADNTTAKGREQNRRVMVRFFAPAE